MLRPAMTVSLLVPTLLLGSLAASAAASHPCDAVGGVDRYVCDPDVLGDFYRCLSDGRRLRFACQPGSIFNNDLQACDHAYNGYVCPKSAASGPASAPSSSTPPTASASTPAPAPSPTTTATSGGTTATAGEDSSASSRSLARTSTNPPPRAVSQGHPCDAVSAGSMACNPANGGRSYYWCLAGGTVHEIACPSGTVFSNEKQACDWWQSGYVCNGPSSGGSGASSSSSSSTSSSSAGAGPTTTTTTTTTTPAPLPQGECNASNCVLPDCLCVGTSIPRLPGQSLTLDQVPQMVLLTFDDDVNNNNFRYYETLFPGNQSAARKNPNGCRAGATFFVSDGWTNMTQVQLLASRGSELASHSRDHSWPTQWTAQDWTYQMQGMRQKLANKTQVPLSKIVGMRAPFLELGGEDQFSMLTHNGFLYDSSMFGGTNGSAPPLWPFTLAHPPKASPELCDQDRCPAGSYPEIWEVPIIRQYHPVSGKACSMTDAGCVDRGASEDEVYGFLLHNFNRHYLTNRSPFMISLHAAWFGRVPNSFAGLRRFLDFAGGKSDVWQITVTQMLDWVRDPTPLSSSRSPAAGNDNNNVGIASWQCAASSSSSPSQTLP